MRASRSGRRLHFLNLYEITENVIRVMYNPARSPEKNNTLRRGALKGKLSGLSAIKLPEMNIAMPPLEKLRNIARPARLLRGVCIAGAHGRPTSRFLRVRYYVAAAGDAIAA